MAADLFVDLDRTSPVPLHRQLAEAVRSSIRGGDLRRGAALPASRAMAAELQVSRGVVVEAYQQLVAEGFLVSTPGSYTRVAAHTLRLDSPAIPEAHGSGVLVDFGCGQVDPASFPRTAWMRSLRRVLNEVPHSRLSYAGGHGVPELRVAVADYLNRVRGTEADPRSVVVCAGFGQAANLLLTVLARRGAKRIAVEDPSVDDDVRPIAESLGMEIVGIPVDEDGWDLDALDASQADVVAMTPSHQWPVGAVMGASARDRVVQWARRTNAFVIEDDYDAEYRYDGPAVGALQGRAPDRVAYVGTSSKTLVPGLRLGWMVLPRQLVEPVAAAKYRADRGSPAIDQLAFADFLEQGELDRHLRRMRPVYRHRRDLLLSSLERHLPRLTVTGIAAGLHLVAWLPDDEDELAIQKSAIARGVRIVGLHRYWLRPEVRSRPGLVFGYTSLSDRTIVDGVELLAESWPK